MAITSKGYEKDINYTDWAAITSHLGGTYGVFGGPGSLAATAGSGDRQVVIAPGEAGGAGILDNIDSPVTVSGAAVSSGSRWDMIVLRREWGAVKATTVAIKTGSASKALPSRAVGPGALDEQPLWLVRFTAGQTAPQEFVDLRVWHGDGGFFANDLLVRNYMSRVGTQLRIGASVWTRILSGGVAVWFETKDEPLIPYSRLTGVPDPAEIKSGVQFLRVGSDNAGPRLYAPRSLIYDRTYTKVNPGSFEESLVVVTPAGTLGRMAYPIGIAGGGTGASTRMEALFNLGVFADEWSGQRLNAGQSREYTISLPGNNTRYSVIAQPSQRNLGIQWVRTSNMITIKVFNETSTAMDFSLSFQAMLPT
ncbi:hypothetical protein [Microbacterium sp.]|uniref:hypothetical protein n=1 Tax=Microbacterium sp. TaxID=51671 RepID=UPI0039E4ECBB